jgi:single-stranded-DNA-specific exonuclease
MNQIWIDPEKVVVPENLIEAVGGHPLVAETLVRRGIVVPKEARAFLDPGHYTPTPASELPGIAEATTRIHRAINNSELILVWGDFDVDGQTSTTLLVEALRELGAEVTHHIPIRATEGHGIKVEVLEEIIEANPAITLILTCDTGIAAKEAVDFANSRGLDVVITDHHDLPEELPKAYATVDPKLLPDRHPLATLPGVGVAYKLVEALLESRQPTDNSSQRTEKYLDLVALGIVADVAEQREDTRYLLQRGLNVLRNTQRLGLQTLMELAQIAPNQLDEGHIGFGIGPRLNALGRLSDANPIVEFLTTADTSRARVLATQLEGLNERRKLLTEQITQAVLTQIEQDRTLIEKAALVLYHPGWHTGVIGIVASRLVERFGKPTILLSIGEDGIARGSARSIEGVHITEAIATQKELLQGFGGHPGAAGLSLLQENIPQFRRGFTKAVQSQVGDQPPEPIIQIDAYLPLADISLELVNDIRQLAPFGAGNPALTLASRNLSLISQTEIGPRKNHLRIVVADEAGYHQNVFWWNGVGNPLPETDTPFDLAYTIHASTFRGEQQLQIQWVDFQSITEAVPETENEVSPLEVIDLQDEANPLAALKSIQAKQHIQVWAEGAAESKIGGSHRFELTTSEALAIWTTPPSHQVWQDVLKRVDPQKVYVFAIDPQLDNPQLFLGRLTGLVKFALRSNQGKVHLENLAAAVSHSENTVRMGLLWLEGKGFIKIRRRDEFVIWIESGDRKEKTDLEEITIDLQTMLSETAAYRRYFAKTAKNLT